MLKHSLIFNKTLIVRRIACLRKGGMSQMDHHHISYSAIVTENSEDRVLHVRVASYSK